MLKIIISKKFKGVTSIIGNFSISAGKKLGSPTTTFGDDDLNYLQLSHSGRFCSFPNSSLGTHTRKLQLPDKGR